MHIPVMLDECLEGLAIDPQGIYVDGTLGNGGHAAAILEQLKEGGMLIGFDRDIDAETVDHYAFLFDQPKRDVEAVFGLAGAEPSYAALTPSVLDELRKDPLLTDDFDALESDS